ncbi:hypothetical protein QJQ45_001012 [Haematococcus lacustris]|nr:hypothetical protein QJQ45_001012 [Haematococcus lacustris]
MPPKRNGQGDNAPGKRQNKAQEKRDSPQVPKSRPLPPSRRFSAASNGELHLAVEDALLPSTSQKVEPEQAGAGIVILPHDVTDHLESIYVTKYTKEFAARKPPHEGVCKYVKWAPATYAIVGASCIGVLRTMGQLPPTTNYNSMVTRVHKSGHNNVGVAPRNKTLEALASAKKANKDLYEQWHSVWGPYFDRNEAPPAWGRLILVGEQLEKGIFPEPVFFTVKIRYLPEPMAMAFDEVIRKIVADKKITLKLSELREVIDAELKSRQADVLDIATSLGPAIKKAQDDVDKAEAERVAAEAAGLAAEVAAARANNSARAEKKTAKRVKLEQEVAAVQATFAARIQALEEDDHVSGSDNEA